MPAPDPDKTHALALEATGPDTATRAGASEILVGTLLDHRYLVDRVLGVGAMGAVYRATHVDLDRPVALKVLHPSLNSEAEMRARFFREARTASLLNHRGAVTVHDFGEWDGRLCIAMDFLEGPNLAQLLAGAFPLPRERVVDLMGQLCDVLAAAHSLDLLHRDLKPDNILIVTEPNGRERLKVVDFGLAILLDRGPEDRITRDGAVAGTPVYMSPEQALLRPLDHRSNLYAFGCILYEVLCGVPPFRGRSAVDIFSKHLYHEPVSPAHRARSGQVDPALAEIALWCLEKEPDNRPASAEVIGQRLRRSLSDNPPTFSNGGRRWDFPGSDRHKRVTAAGIRPVTERMVSGAVDPRGGRIAVIQPGPPTTPTEVEQADAVLTRHGFTLGQVVTPMLLEAGLGTLDADAVVFDIRPDIDANLALLRREVASGALVDLPVVVVGPNESFDAIASALEAGASDYLGEVALDQLPRKVVGAMRRATRASTLRVPRPRRITSGPDSNLENTNLLGGLHVEPELDETQIITRPELDAPPR